MENKTQRNICVSKGFYANCRCGVAVLSGEYMQKVFCV